MFTRQAPCQPCSRPPHRFLCSGWRYKSLRAWVFALELHFLSGVSPSPIIGLCPLFGLVGLDACLRSSTPLGPLLSGDCILSSILCLEQQCCSIMATIRGVSLMPCTMLCALCVSLILETVLQNFSYLSLCYKGSHSFFFFPDIC